MFTFPLFPLPLGRGRNSGSLWNPPDDGLIIQASGSASDPLDAKDANQMMPNRHLAALRLVLALLFVSGIGCRHPGGRAEEPASVPRQPTTADDWLETSRQEAADRHFARALVSARTARRIDPENLASYALEAEFLFRMDDAVAAETFCAMHRERAHENPDFTLACWAAVLDAHPDSPESRKQIRKEISQWVSDGPASYERLTAAYEGWSFLGDRARRRQTAVQAAEAARNPLEKEQSAATLFEEVLEAPDATTRLPLAFSYLRNNPNGRMAHRAASVYLEALMENRSDETAEAVSEKLLTETGSGRRRDLGIAIWRVEKKADPDRTLELLEKALLVPATETDPPPTLFEPDAWTAELQKERDMTIYWKARALLLQGRTERALELLETVTKRRPDWSGPHHVLGDFFASRGSDDRAIFHLRRAIELSGRRESDLPVLKKILQRRHAYDGDPRAFFQEMNPSVQFTDITAAAGLARVSGQRIAWSDVDEDGWDDLLVDGRHLFKNEGDGTFVDVTTDFLPPFDGAVGGIFGDVDNDGYRDLFLFGKRENRLYRNVKGTRFEDRSDRLPEVGRKGPTRAAAWGEVDNDGQLDLYLANDERPGIMRGLGVRDRLLRYDGNAFIDGSDALSIGTDEPLCARSVLWSDLNLDGYLDLAVGNYRLDPNLLWMNNGGMNFFEGAALSPFRGHGVDGAFGHSLSLAAEDWDGDGNIDLYVSNLSHPRYAEYSDRSMLLFRGDTGVGNFIDRFGVSGIHYDETSGDVATADIDNDGDPDLYVTSVYKGRYSHLYVNDGTGRFTDASWLSATRIENAWGSAFADFDRDGFADLAVASPDGIRLFRNRGNRNSWVRLEIDDRACNRDGIGARIFIRAGSDKRIREVRAGRGSGNQDALRLPIGLGNQNGAVLTVQTLCGARVEQSITKTGTTVRLVIDAGSKTR